MKNIKHIVNEHKLVNSERELVLAVIVFACMIGAGTIVLLAIAMG